MYAQKYSHIIGDFIHFQIFVIRRNLTHTPFHDKARDSPLVICKKMNTEQYELYTKHWFWQLLSSPYAQMIAMNTSQKFKIQIKKQMQSDQSWIFWMLLN